MYLKSLKYKIKYKFQRFKKGYSDEDLFDIDGWFINIFPKMLNEFFECTCGYPDTDEIKKYMNNIPEQWLEQQKPIINNRLKKYDSEYDLTDGMCCWLIILLRMKYCFELCEEWNSYYDNYWENNDYEKINDEVEKNKKEAFYLFEKYFFHLWW